jgi:hypothetical protein
MTAVSAFYIFFNRDKGAAAVPNPNIEEKKRDHV